MVTVIVKIKWETWCHCTPAETPTRLCIIAICPKKDVHCVGGRRDVWRQEEKGTGWFDWGVATAVVHQGCPVPICDLDMVPLTIRSPPNSKVGELQPQYLSTLHLNCLGLLKVVRVIARVVWWSKNTCKTHIKTGLVYAIFLANFEWANGKGSPMSLLIGG